tara:strand:+ start:4495 stop:5091 length:597 start_codon:yes stop_codon:yes gene_type:complete
MELIDELLQDVQIIPGYKEGHAETLVGEDAKRAGFGNKPTILINTDKYPEGSDSYYKMIKFESLHLLKHKKPKLYKKILNAALNDPEYKKQMDYSFEVVKCRQPNDEGYVCDAKTEADPRNKEQWHRVSRFDQVLGGYLMAGDADLPTMKNWNREDMVFKDISPEFRNELNNLVNLMNPEEATLNKKAKTAKTFIDAL